MQTLWGWQISALLFILIQQANHEHHPKRKWLYLRLCHVATHVRVQVPSLDLIFKKPAPVRIKFSELLPPGLRLAPFLCLSLNKRISPRGECHCPCHTVAAIMSWCQLQQQLPKEAELTPRIKKLAPRQLIYSGLPLPLRLWQRSNWEASFLSLIIR